MPLARVYILKTDNTKYSDILKIGSTGNTLEERARQLNNAKGYKAFRTWFVAWSIRVPNAQRVEIQAHRWFRRLDRLAWRLGLPWRWVIRLDYYGCREMFRPSLLHAQTIIVLLAAFQYAKQALKVLLVLGLMAMAACLVLWK